MVNTHAWFIYANTCPVCEGPMDEDFDIDTNRERISCTDQGCSRFYVLRFSVNDVPKMHLVVELKDQPKDEQAALDLLKHCSKCGGPLGSAGDMVVCDGLRCGGYRFYTLDGKRRLVMVSRNEVVR